MRKLIASIIKAICFGNKIISSDFDIAQLKLEDLDGDSHDEFDCDLNRFLYGGSLFLLWRPVQHLKILPQPQCGHNCPPCFGDYPQGQQKQLQIGLLRTGLK